MFLIFFFATPVWFPRKSIPHLISGKIHPRLISEKIRSKPPRKTNKIAIFFAPCVFRICSRGLFAFMPMDLNFTNPNSTIFEKYRQIFSIFHNWGVRVLELFWFQSVIWLLRKKKKNRKMKIRIFLFDVSLWCSDRLGRWEPSSGPPESEVKGRE